MIQTAGFLMRAEEVGVEAAVLNLAAVAYVGDSLTDGVLPFSALEEVLWHISSLGVSPGRQQALARFVPISHRADELVEQLTAAGLWFRDQQGWLLADASSLPTRAELHEAHLKQERQRLGARLRQRASRDKKRSRDSGEPGHVTPHPSFGPPIEALGSNGTASREQSDVQPAAAAAVLPDEHELAARVADFESALARGGDDLIRYAVSQLRSGVQENRTFAAAKSVLARWDLPDQAIVDVLARVQRRREQGYEFFGTEASYFVGALRRMGEDGDYQRRAL